MPHFLTQAEIYRVLQRELPPDDAYPDGAPSAFFSTAESSAVAKVFGDAYASDEDIYLNYFPVSASGNLADHEFAHFGFTLDQALGLDARRTRLLAKIRTRRRTTAEDIKNTVYTIIDSSIPVDIVADCTGSGWILDESLLDISTILNEFNGLERTGPDLCTLDAADYGFTPEEFQRYQDQAYTYYVLIYGYTLTAQEAADLESVLLASEPARSKHIILDGLDPSDTIGGGT
jgi:hypothetical protein